jgi:hypothetical protein
MKTKILAFLAISSVVFFSCQTKEESTSADQSAALLKSATITATDVAVQSASVEATLEADFYAGYERILRELAHVKGRKGDLLHDHDILHYVQGESPVVSIDTAEAGYPITITIDYGTGIETDHGKVIKGTVLIVMNGDKNTDGSTREITFTDYAIDTIGVNGTSIEKFIGDNTATRKITSNSDVTFIINDQTTLVRKGEETSEWLAGVSTSKDLSDDKEMITGSVNVNNTTDNITYSRTITTGLIELGDCRNIVSGTVEYRQDGELLGTLDYGDGTCDDLATLAVGGTITEVTLKGPREGKGGNSHNSK